MIRPIALALIAGCMAGCVAPAAPAPGVTATGSLALRDAGGRSLLATLEPWKQADIDHVSLALFVGEAGSSVATATIAGTALTDEVKFTNLVRNQTYRVEATAYDADDVRIDALAAHPTDCTTTFETTTDLQVSMGKLKLRLADKTFAGAGAATGIEVTDGGIADTTATQTIVVGN